MTSFTLYILTHEGICKKGQFASQTIVKEYITCLKLGCQSFATFWCFVYIVPGLLKSEEKSLPLGSFLACVAAKREDNRKEISDEVVTFATNDIPQKAAGNDCM